MHCKDAAADILWTHLTDATPAVAVSAVGAAARRLLAIQEAR
jgi:hypothetical protein